KRMANLNEEELLRTPVEDEEMLDGNIEQLRQEVEGLGQRKANSLMEQDSGNEAAQGKGLQDLDAIAPAVLRDYAERRIRAMSRNATIIGHREQWRDSNRVQLFQSFLRKNALTIFETLPREVREGTYDEVIEAMKARMRIDGNSQRVKALADLRLLAMRPVRLLKKAIDRKVDLDEYIERIPGPNTKVRDASGNIMEFFDTIRIAIRLEDQVEVVSAFVGRSPDEVVILGTNALDLFNLRLLKGTGTKSEHMAAKRTASVAAENSALICNINENEEPIRIPFDALIVVPNEVESPARTTKTKRKMRRRANSNKIACRATTDGIDTSPLGLFFRCPGRHGQENDGYRYTCTIQEKTFKDVVPDAPEAIANLRFDTIFGLARLLSIYEHERNEERKRFLMLDHKYCSISVTGAQKAFLFYKKFCDHVFRSLILHDGSSLRLPHDGGTGWPIEQLNQATNEAVRYAQANSWDEVNVKEPNTTLLLLPDSFRAITAAFRENAYVERRLYSKLSEVSGFLERSVARICVLVGPTTDEPPAKRDWCKLASSLATAARMGMKVIAVAPPRGDRAYMQNRSDLNDAIELARSAAVLMKQGLRSSIPVIESPHEPSHGPGAHPRSSSAEAYSRDVIKEYYDALRTYVKAEVDLPPLESAAKSRSSRTRLYFKQKRLSGGVSKEKLKATFTPFRNNHFRMQSMVAPICSPQMPILQYPQWMCPSTSAAPRCQHGRGRGARRGYNRPQ
ncbi:hypothetical protein V3C99_013667, partial [Haemonchus contortus]